MTRKLLVFILLATLGLTGCNKVKSLIGRKGAAATPTPAPALVASNEPAPPSPPDISAPAPEPAAPAVAPAAPATAPVAAATPPPAPKAAVDKTAGAMVLCYHNIEDTTKSKALTITVKQFEEEMEALKTNGFTVIGMQDFIAWRKGEKNIPKKSCIITIDDGWLSGYTVAWPILKKYGYPFTMFIYVNYVGTGGKSLSWAQLEEMRDAGVDIQSHTYSHSSLKIPGGGQDKTNSAKVKQDVATLGLDGWLKKEIIDSKKVLEQHLGIKVNAFAYPFGVYTTKARELVKQAGYEAAFTVYGQRLSMTSPSFDLLGRYAIEANKPKTFQSALQMIGGGAGPDDSAPASSVAQLAAAGMITQPLNNETIQTATPLIKANLSSMGAVEPGSVQVRLSGVGPVPAKFDPATKMLTAQVTQKLKPGGYSVIVSAVVNGQRAETRWDFTVSSTAGAGTPAAAPKPAPGLPAPPSPPQL